MEREIEELRKRYQSKRHPIIEAMAQGYCIFDESASLEAFRGATGPALVGKHVPEQFAQADDLRSERRLVGRRRHVRTTPVQDACNEVTSTADTFSDRTASSNPARTRTLNGRTKTYCVTYYTTGLNIRGGSLSLRGGMAQESGPGAKQR